MSGDGRAEGGSARRRPAGRRWLAGLGILAVLAVVGFVVVTVANKVVYSPEARANAYLDALAARDTDAVFDLLRPDLPVERQALLTPEILESTDPVVADVEIDIVNIDGDRAQITADATIDDDPVRLSLELEKVGSRLGVLDDWKITDPGLGSMIVRAPSATTLTVNGVDVDVPGLADGVGLAAFPGTYEIMPSGDLPSAVYDQANPAGSSVRIVDDTELVSFTLGPDDDLVASVTAQADAYLDACFAQTVPRPEGCPNAITADIQADSIQWAITQRPTYDISPADGGGWEFTSDGGVGGYTAMYVDGGGDAAGQFTRGYPFQFSGTIAVASDGTATIEVTDTYTPARLGAAGA